VANEYKIRRSKAGTSEKPYTTYMVTIPARIAEAISELDDRVFAWEFAEEGLLLREVTDGNMERDSVPDWAR
jgi:hypothetical protein